MECTQWRHRQAHAGTELLFVGQNNELNYVPNVHLKLFGLEHKDFQLV